MADRRNDIIEDLKTRLDLIEGVLDDGDTYSGGTCARCADIREIVNGKAASYREFVRGKLLRELTLKRQMAIVRRRTQEARTRQEASNG